MIEKQAIDYECGNVTCHGVAYWDASIQGKRPAVLVVHAWRGQDDFARERAMELARKGYVAFAVDLYGNGISVANNEDAAALMAPLFLDRSLLRSRIIAAYKSLAALPTVDPERIAAIGFCFGGLTVIELLRSGVRLRGCVSFHGILGDNLGDMHAVTAAPAKKINGALLILHGNDDPLVSQGDIDNIRDEMSHAGVDWQFHIYGNTYHAFTNPVANDSKGPFLYNARVAARAFASMESFLTEIFQ
jgi:dienelactone hydrolase